MVNSYVLNLSASLLGKKWRKVILWELRGGALRFSELKVLIPNISVKVLSQTLREMEGHLMIIRIQYPTIPVKVTYELHEDIIPLVTDMHEYKILLMQYILKNQTRLSIPADIVQDIELALVSK